MKGQEKGEREGGRGKRRREGNGGKRGGKAGMGVDPIKFG